jgi:hypothetical protein
MVAEAQKVMLANNETKQHVAEHSAVIKSDYSASMQVMQALMGQTVAGKALTLIMGLIIKTKK